jgi:hypothetical protein
MCANLWMNLEPKSFVLEPPTTLLCEPRAPFKFPTTHFRSHMASSTPPTSPISMRETVKSQEVKHLQGMLAVEEHKRMQLEAVVKSHNIDMAEVCSPPFHVGALGPYEGVGYSQLCLIGKHRLKPFKSPITQLHHAPH